jgi:hypothetical protein
MKKAIGILLVLLLVVGGGVWYFVTYRMDSMIQKQIETAVSVSLGTQVSVGEVTTDIKGGSLTISNVTIANPSGFKNKNAFILNGIEAAVDYANLDVKRVVIDRPEIVIEEMGGETNFSLMMAELEKQQSAPATNPEADPGTDPGADSGADHAPATEGEKERIVVIRHFRMNESRASFESESLGKYSSLKVDAIELNNIKGTPSEVADVIATKIITEVSKQAAFELIKAKAVEKINSIFKKDKD